MKSRTAKYRWTITRDRIEGETEYSAKGKEGPRNLDPTITDNPVRFSMYGTPYAGCSAIKIDGEWL